MEITARVIDRISNTFAVIAGIFMIGGAGLIITEIIMRSVFNSTIYISSEYAAYFMAALTFLGMAYTLKEKGHIRMTFMYKVIKKAKSRLFLDIYACVIGLVIFIVIAITTADLFWESFVLERQSMQISRTYIAIPQFVMPLGAALISLQFVGEIIKTLIKFRTGELGSEDDTENKDLGH